jgi:hypothetical protein
MEIPRICNDQGGGDRYSNPDSGTVPIIRKIIKRNIHHQEIVKTAPDPSYENYPARVVLASNLLTFAIYVIGAFIVSQLGLIPLFVFILYILLLEIRLVKGHCVSCYYYGKACAFGRGRVSCLFFRKGNPEDFTGMSIRWYDLLPDFLAFIVPIIVGLGLLVIHFDVILLAVIIVLFVLITFGNGMVRGQFACKYCKQRELGCPAEKLFAKKDS